MCGVARISQSKHQETDLPRRQFITLVVCYGSDSVEQKSINHVLSIDDLKLYGSNKREAEKLTNTVRIFTKDIRMELGVNKFAHVTMKRGKIVNTGGIELTSGQTIEKLESDKGCKYLGILEADDK